MSKKCWCLTKTVLGIGIVYIHLCPKIRRKMCKWLDRWEEDIKDRFV